MGTYSVSFTFTELKLNTVVAELHASKHIASMTFYNLQELDRTLFSNFDQMATTV